MRGGQHRQQRRAPQLSRAQRVPPPTCAVARTNLGNKVIGNVGTPTVPEEGWCRQEAKSNSGTHSNSPFTLHHPTGIGLAHRNGTRCKNFRNTLF